MTARNGASRRQILKVAGVTGAAVAAVVATRVAQRPARAQSKEKAEKTSASPKAAPDFLADLTGKMLGAYAVRSVGPIDRGGVPVILANANGEAFRVDVLRAEPLSAAGIGVVSTVSVYLRNGGDGRTLTDEERGLGAMALAEELARRSRNGEKPPAALLTMSERAALDAVS
jgi:hypothetical protein